MKKRSQKATSNRLPKQKDEKLLSRQNNVDIVEDSDIYISTINQAKRDFLASGLDPDLLTDISVFNGLLRYIYIHVFKPDRKTCRNCKLDYSLDSTMIVLSDIFDYYCVSLCAPYGITPTIYGFSILTGIGVDTFTEWKNKDNNNIYKHRLLEKIYATSEAGIASKALENNSIGAMFFLKSKFSWIETTTQNVNITRSSPKFTLEQLQAKHVLLIDPDVEKDD